MKEVVAMLKKMLRHTLFSACLIGIVAGGYAVTYGGGLEAPYRAHHH